MKNFYLLAFLLCFAVGGFSGFIGAQENFIEEEAYAFRIGSGDILEVSVYGVPGMHAPPIKARVSQKGTVILPLLGEVELGGLTAEEASLKLDELFRAGYLADPQVTVFISERTGKGAGGGSSVSILGLVAYPGNYRMIGKTSIADALALAGGASRGTNLRPNTSAIKVIRQVGEEEEIFLVNLDQEGRKFIVQPNDVLSVESYGPVIVTGNVVQPGAVQIWKNFSLAHAIQSTGGALPNANLEAVKVLRREENELGEIEENIYVVNYMEEGPDFIMQEKDRVIVEPYGSFAIYGEVMAQGNYFLTKELTVMDAIMLAGGFSEFASKNSVKIVRYTEGKRKIIKVLAAKIIRTGDRSKDAIIQDGDTVIVPEAWF